MTQNDEKNRPRKSTKSQAANGERGAALLELALVFPILMTTVLGMFSLGYMLNQYLELTDAVAVGGQVLAVDRGQDLTPCADAISKIENAAPFLTPSSMTFNFTFNTTSYGPYTGGGSTTSCTAANSNSPPASNLIQGDPIVVTVTYPCTIGVFNNANLVPGCTLTAQITEISQ